MRIGDPPSGGAAQGAAPPDDPWARFGWLMGAIWLVFLVFPLAGAAAALTGTGLVPLRKAGRLPAPAARADYTLEYGNASIEVSEDLRAGSRVLLLDDVLATGGTLAAGRRLIEARGAEVVGAACLLELTALGGRAVVPDTHVLFAS